MRQREKIEQRYERLLKKRSTSIKDINKNVTQELNNLRRQVDLNKTLLSGREKQLSKLGSETYTDSKGKTKSFSKLGVTKYAKYDAKSGTIQIDWAAIDKVKDKDKGGAIEAYISRLEFISKSIEDTQDTIEDIEDSIYELKQRNKDTYLELEERVYDAIVESRQKQIDAFQTMSDAIDEATNAVINNIQKEIEEQRQIKENTKAQDEINDKENRLAYLQRDTSGANATEILRLQKEIKDAREAQSDSLVDQAISQMQEDASLAAEQRAKEIEVMQAQLDIAEENGEFWNATYDLIRASINDDGTLANNSELVTLLQDTDGFKGMSFFGQENWIDDMVEEWLKAQEGLGNFRMENAERRGTLTLGNGTALKYDANKKTWSDNKGNTYKDVHWDEQAGEYVGINNNDVPTTTPTATNNQPAQQTSTGKEITDAVKKGVAGAIWNGGQGWGTGDTRKKRLKEVFGAQGQKDIQSYVNKKKTGGKPANYSYSKMKKTTWKKYADGGFADYTGPAWLDGTKSHPEAVLSAQDTKNFVMLRNILAQAMSGDVSSVGSGDNYFDINISADIGSDYDVDKLASRIKKQIYDDGAYRNVNTLNRLR